MDALAAKKVLGLDPEFTSEELTKRYRILSKRLHPDVPKTGNKDGFIQVSLAYTLLKSITVGLTPEQGTTSDYEYALQLSTEIDTYVDATVDGFVSSIRRLQSRFQTELQHVIMRARSPGDLRKAIESDVAHLHVDVSTELKRIMQKLGKDVDSIGGEMIFGLFKEQFAARRRYWLINLYRNKLTVGFALSEILVFAARLSAVRDNIPVLYEIASHWHVPVAILAVCAAMLYAQYTSLDPKTQFLPPRLSLANIHRSATETAGGVTSTPGEAATTGGVLAVLALPFIVAAPIVIPLAALSALVASFFGTDLNESKRKAYETLRSEFNFSVDQILQQVSDWSESCRVRIRALATENFEINCKRIVDLDRHLQVRLLGSRGPDSRTSFAC